MDLTNLKTKEVFIENEMKDAYISYAMSVIVGRALPDVRDGLKPVHRRIIYSMYKEGLDKRFSKSAKVVGDVLGKYHPHGDSSVYEAMVRLAQDWAMRYKIVKGQGNFGSIDGDRAAAYRYTEARMEKLTSEFLVDIEKDTVDFMDTFDGTNQEPKVLPTRVPNLLMNGSSGIAVGMATSIPPHNINEVIDATCHVIDNMECTVEELVRENFIKGPDFPTAATILNKATLRDLYLNGEGPATMKAVCEIEDMTKSKQAIIIKEIPYQLNKVNLINQIVDLVRNGKIQDISDIRDESNKKGIRVVIELKANVDANIILNNLYKFTSLQMNFNSRFLTIVNGTPKILNLKEYLSTFISFRKEVLVRKTKFSLKKNQERLHILEGLKIAIENIDQIIKLIKASKTSADAKEGLMKSYNLSDIQTQAILELKLQKLTGLEIEKLIEEYDAILKTIKSLEEILKDVPLQYKIIKDDLLDIKDKYGDERKSIIINDEGDVDIEDLLKDEDFAVMITQNDYIKKVPIENYRTQKRGGKGSNVNLKEEDTIKNLFIANSKDKVLIFTNDGNINWLKVYQIPSGTTISKGRPIVNYIDLKGKKITNVINVENLEKGKLIFLTKKGIIKKIEMKNFSKPRNGGIKAIKLNEGDSVLSVIYTNTDEDDIVCQSNVGLAIRFSQSDLSDLGRTAKGVKAMNLRDKETVVGIELAKSGTTLLSICENGFGKRTLLSQYSTIKRAGRGVIDIKTDKRNGEVVGMKAVKEDDEILAITKLGKVIRIKVGDVRIIGRNTKGVKIVNLEGDDLIEKFELIKSEENLE